MVTDAHARVNNTRLAVMTVAPRPFNWWVLVAGEVSGDRVDTDVLGTSLRVDLGS